MGFFVMHVHGRVLGLMETHVQRLKNAYATRSTHQPSVLALQEAVGSPSISRICRWKRVDLNYAPTIPRPLFLEKLFLALKHVIYVPRIIRFRAPPNRCTAALDATNETSGASYFEHN
jgi:hypothetical protein